MFGQDFTSDYVCVTPHKDDCVYTRCYCEENVWKLCEFISAQKQVPAGEVHVVFISNERRMIPLWKQKSGQEDEPVIWDYHVILLHVSVRWGQSFIYDLDSTLPFPCDLQLYAAQAFRSDQQIKSNFHRKLRVVSSEDFLKTFASDRSHMKDTEGAWRMPPPPYLPIHTAESVMNLDDFISMEPAMGPGRVYSLSEFVTQFGRQRSHDSPAAV
ncbi:protein N-terminal glutamine amidohydrolase isoform X2 [Lampris incognitus]|uniref:protein N-terminal glutamine amidohydrolase isoform X2 n=1 Tax=Lampris incognitus TaxID=2546036 RepID=UPI0024B50575|nr:protein N-terminal glutamine amidohydrolase isoform X2 [Lampris incognitus]